MSSAGGGSGIGGGGMPGNIAYIEGSQVQLGDAKVDLQTADGVAQAEAMLSPEQMQELEGLMREAGFERDGSSFVPKDDFALRKELGLTGPTDSQASIAAADMELAENVFVASGFPNPINSNTTENTFNTISGSAEFNDAVGAMTTLSANPTGANTAEFMDRMQALETKFPNGNVMEVLFLVFRESIKETNQDKKYFLIKLQEFNKMAEEISDYLSYLVDRSQALSEKAEGQKYPEKVHIDVDVKQFDLSTLNKDGKLSVESLKSRSLDRAGLNDTIKDVESMQETVRNKRQMASTAFQNFDQKANQLYNLMSSVLKSLNEMRGGTVRNML